MTKKTHTKSLISMERLDIALKILYINEYVNSNGGKYKELYRQHIEHRTAYLEDHKSTAEDFFSDFNKLIDSVKTSGFDERYPIITSAENGMNLSGAHRLACALYFNVDQVPTKVENKEGLSWGRDWFENHHFDQLLIEELELTLLSYLNTTTFVIWNPLYQYFPDILSYIKSESNVLIDREIPIDTNKQLMELVNDIYSYELGPSVSNIIEGKGLQLSSYNARTIKLVVVPELTQSQTLLIKDMLRNMYNEIVNKDLYMTIHSSDDSEHSKYLYSLMLSSNNLNALKSRVGASKKLSSWLDELYDYCTIEGLKRSDICIVGSSSMDVFGIRESTDIDFILKHAVRERKFTSEVHELTPNIDLAFEGYLRLASKSLTDDMVIDSHLHHSYYRGFKFIALEDVLARKKVQCREKDISDVKLIDIWLCNSRRNEINFVSKLKFMLWNYFVARPKYYKTRIKTILRKYLPKAVIEGIKRVFR